MNTQACKQTQAKPQLPKENSEHESFEAKVPNRKLPNESSRPKAPKWKQFFNFRSFFYVTASWNAKNVKASWNAKSSRTNWNAKTVTSGWNAKLKRDNFTSQRVELQKRPNKLKREKRHSKVKREKCPTIINDNFFLLPLVGLSPIFDWCGIVLECFWAKSLLIRRPKWKIEKCEQYSLLASPECFHVCFCHMQLTASHDWLLY